MMGVMYLTGKYVTVQSVGAVMSMVCALILFGALLLLFGWWISKRKATRAKA